MRGRIVGSASSISPSSLERNYENLCNAVIMQAVRDYKTAYRIRKKHPRDRVAKQEVESLEKFFCGEYFSVFTDLDGSALLDKLQDMLEEED